MRVHAFDAARTGNSMLLLVSVRSRAEAGEALAGGADLIDAKDPERGALAPVSLRVLEEILERVGGNRPVTAALGDADDASEIEHLAEAYARAGASFVKVGFRGIARATEVSRLLSAAARGVRRSGSRTALVAVAYADEAGRTSLSVQATTRVAVAAGADGLLVDTSDKKGPGLTDLIRPDVLAAWTHEAQGNGLFVALAGKLRAADLALVQDTGANIAGVRGAACIGSRVGSIDQGRIRLLRKSYRAPPPFAPAGSGLQRWRPSA